MAIEFYSSIDLNQNEIQRPVIHNSGTISDGNGTKGQLYVHNTQNKLYFHDGTNFIDLTAQGDITGVTLTGGNGITATNTNSSGGAYSSTITLDISDSSLTTASTIAQIDLLAFSDESASNDPTKNITFSNLEDQIFSNMNSASSDVAVAAGGAITLAADCVDSAEIADGAVDNVHLANSSIQIGGTSMSLGSGYSAITGPISITGLTDLDLAAASVTIFDTVGSNTLTMGASGTTIAIPGNLTVAGTTTYKNETIQIVADNSLAFRAGDGNSHEIILTAADATSDKTITLPNATGTVALTSQITGSNTGTNTGDVTLGGSLDYLTISNQVITRNAINLTTDVTGTLPTANTAAKVVSIVAGDGIDVNNSGVGNVTVTAEEASATNPGIVELAADTEVKAGSGAGKVVDASQLGARSVVGTIAVGSLTGNKRAEIAHNLATEDVIVQLFDASTKQTVYADVYRTEANLTTVSTNAITVDFGNTPETDVEFIIISNAGATTQTTINYS